MTSVLPDNDAQLAAWFAKLEQLEEPKRTQMLTWVKQEFARERSLRNHANAGELAASLDPAWVMTEANRMIAEAIEECLHTRRGRLLITVPPQEGKTSLGAVWGIIRALQWYPEWRCMLASFGSTLAEESSVAARNLIAAHGTDAKDPLTQTAGSDALGLALAYDKASAAAWRLRGHRGGLVAVGLGGTISGRPADCVSGNTHIVTEHGNTTAEAAYERGDQWIVGYDHHAESAVWRRVEARRRIDGRAVVDVLTDSGRVLTCTPDHRVYTSRGYAAAGSLTGGEVVVTLQGSDAMPVRSALGGNPPGHPQVPAPRPESVLLPGLCEDSPVRAEPNPPVSVRWADPAITEVDVLGRVPARVAVQELDVDDLPRVRSGVSTEVAPHAVLRPEVRESGAFTTDDRRRESSPQNGQQLREMVPVDAADHLGARRALLRGVRRDSAADRVHLARSRKDTLTAGHSPHRRESPEQPSMESDHAVHHLPCDPPQVDADTVALVRPGSGGPQPVYDFQVEGTRNFFAEGVLVHNCLIIDDPIKGMEAADSKATKKHLIESFQGDLTTRLAPGAPIILIQCMTGDTPVLRPDGGETPLRDIRPGDEIATYENGGLTSSTVTNWRNNGPDQVRLIRTRSGRTVRANARHPFLVIRKGEEEWVRLQDLRIGDDVVATSSTADVCTMPEGSARTTTAANVDQIPTVEDATSKAVIGRIRPAAYAHRTTDDNWMMSATSESIQRATGESGLASPARSTAAASPSPAKACVPAATARTDGRRGTEHHPIPAPFDATATCGTGTESALTSTANVSPIRAGYAPAAENHHRTTTCPSTGRASCALTTTTTLEKSGACCAMSATSCFVETTPRSICATDSTTWTVTLDEIVEIADAGIEDVYDITVDRTENFIANGLASHNTRWAVDDLAGWILAREEKLPAEKRRWRHLNIPALAEDGLLDSLGREPGTWLVSSRGRTPQDWQETRDIVGSRVWASLYQGSPSPLEGGLIKKQWLIDHRLTLVPPNPLLTVVGVDPSDSGHGDDAGIIAAQLDDKGNRVSMIADRSEPLTSDKWAKAAVKLAVEVGASKIVVESFAAAETYRRVVEEAIEAEKPPHPIEIVTWPPKGSGRGGGDALVRSTALLQQLENGRTRLVGHFPKFEEQATAWQAGQHQPDGLSALTCAHDELVHAGGLDWDFAAPFDTDNAPVDLENWMGRSLE